MKKLTILILAGVLLSSSLSARTQDNMNKGYQFYKDKDYKSSYHEYKTACFAGDIRGCEMMGLYHKNGLGVKKDINKAIKYLKKACPQYGKITHNACRNLGVIYFYNKDKYKDLPVEEGLAGKLSNTFIGLRYMERACGDKDYESCHRLGYIYYKGTNLKNKSVKEALRYYREGCNGKDDKSCVACALIHKEEAELYSNNKEISKWKKNMEQAKSLYKKSCGLGNDESCIEHDKISKAIFDAF